MSLLDDLPTKHFGAIMCDPPWKFRGWTKNANPDSSSSADRHYRTMTIEQIKALPVRDLASLVVGCHLFLWTTGPMLAHALDVIDAWGFKYSTVAFTWAKLKRSHDPNQLRVVPTIDRDFHVGLGHTTRKNAEFCLLARRGGPRRIDKSVRELIVSPAREHSRKPDEAYARVEKYTCGPYLDLFGREERPGWTVVGDEVGKFGRAA